MEGLRRFAPLRAAGATWKDIAAHAGCDWRTARKYLSPDAPSTPPRASSRAGTVPRLVDPFVGVIDAWLAADPRLRATVIHERLVADYGFTGHYQRVKVYVADARRRLEVEADAQGRPPGLHRRFEVVAGAQAQVDWGDEGTLLSGAGITSKVYSFHMTLSYSRDPFVCFTTSQDLATFFDCHRRAFAHFGGVPATIVYDRTKTVVRRHVAPGKAVPLHPQAAAFAEHYGFVIDVLAAYRPTGKGRVERQVAIVRDHVLAGRSFASLAELDGAFAGWVPIRRGQVHRTHGELIGVRAARDHAALGPVPEFGYAVTESHLRRVGRDSMISFAGSCYSIAARATDGRPTRAGQRVEVRVGPGHLEVWRLPVDDPDGATVLLARHPRSRLRGAMIVDPAHWAELPDGRTRATTTAGADGDPDPTGPSSRQPDSPAVRPEVRAGFGVVVARRPLSDYDQLAGLASPPGPEPVPADADADADVSLVGAA
ncbi:IS21 family transposase [Pseudonocardia broussonetiae]|uniref:IS21 family transposase n=1 Tax=Pseudonocardia broussonetiae TaxID=2736640 RepID=UPI0019662FC2|nr:IS21 family transposase [Pseudonocardia broussonetiae]